MNTMELAVSMGLVKVRNTLNNNQLSDAATNVPPIASTNTASTSRPSTAQQ